MIKPLSRRTLLRGAGGIALGLPLLNAMEAKGAPLEGPRRFGTFLMMAAPVVAKWWPTASTAGLTLPATLASLAPFKEKLTFLKGINYKVADADLGYSDDHHRVVSGLLTAARQLPGQFYLGAGWSGGPSIDQHLARKIGIDPIRSLVVAPGLTWRDDTTRTSYTAAASPVDPYNDPAKAWDAVFKDVSTTDVEYQKALQAIRARRTSVLDAVKGEYALLEKRLGGEDKLKMEFHLDSVRTLEKRLIAIPPMEAHSCATHPRPAPRTSYPNEQYPDVLKAHLEIIAYALRCDLTRVFSLQTSHAVSEMRFPWEGLGINLKQHGEINHTPANYHLLDPISRWYAEQFAYLCQLLDAAPKEGDRSVLENSLVWYTYEHENANFHLHNNVPMFLAGTAGGRIKGNRLLDFKGRSHNDLFVSILQTFGQPDTRFGEPSVCTGPLSGLTT